MKLKLCIIALGFCVTYLMQAKWLNNSSATRSYQQLPEQLEEEIASPSEIFVEGP